MIAIEEVPRASIYQSVVSVAAANAPRYQRARIRCNGENDEVALQAAVDLLPPEGGILKLSKGTFTLGNATTGAGPRVTISGKQNVTIMGSGGTIINRNWVQGTSDLYMFEMRGVDENNRVSNLCLCDLSVQTNAPYQITPTGLIGDGTQSFFFAQSVNHIQVRNIFGSRVAFIIDIRNASEVTCDGITGREVFGCVGLIRTDRANVSNIIADRSQTIVDTGECNSINISNVTGLASTIRNTDEGLDIGATKRISISNFNLEGYYQGIRIKKEGEITPETQSVTVTNGVIHEIVNNGIRIDNVATVTGPRMGPVTISNVEVKSTQSLCGGIRSVDYFDKVTINGCEIEVDGTGVNLAGVDRPIITDNRIKSINENGIRIEQGTNGHCPEIKGNVITTSSSNSLHAGIYVNETYEPVIEGNTILDSINGIITRQCSYPIIRDNVIRRTKREAIYVQYLDEIYVDSGLRYLNFVIDGNHIEDWALDTVAQRAIHLLISGITGAPYKVGSVQGNEFVVTSAGNAPVQQQAGFRLNSTVEVDEVEFKNNRFQNVSFPLVVSGGAQPFGASCQFRNNMGYKTENSGGTTIGSAATSVVVPHGLASTHRSPTQTDFQVTPLSSLASATKFWVSAVDDNNVTISVDVAPGTDVEFAWKAEML